MGTTLLPGLRVVGEKGFTNKIGEVKRFLNRTNPTQITINISANNKTAPYSITVSANQMRAIMKIIEEI